MSLPRFGWFLLLLLVSGVLASCSTAPEKLVTQGVTNARHAFEAEPKTANEKMGQTELYVPKGYVLEKSQDHSNRLITKESEMFSLTINPNEHAASTIFYELQKINPQQLWVVDETFKQSDRFGFATVNEITDDKLELVVGVGGNKISTITTEHKLPENMEWMMKTVRSINHDE